MKEGWDDLTAVIRAIARDELSTSAQSAWGYINSYDPATGLCTVTLPSFWVDPQNAGTKQLSTPPIPLGSPYVGSGYGLELYPEPGTPCLVYIVEGNSGAGLAAVCIYNKANLPAGVVANPGELAITGKGTQSIYLDSSGNIIINGGSTPIAVEGSRVTHYHTLDTFLTAFAAACNATGSTPLVGTSLGSIITALITPATGITDTAGGGGTTTSEVDAGQGMQNVLGTAAKRP